jgi:hypothetical protein
MDTIGYNESRSEVDPGEDEAHPWPEWGEFDIIEWVHEEDEAGAPRGPGDMGMELGGDLMGMIHGFLVIFAP